MYASTVADPLQTGSLLELLDTTEAARAPIFARFVVVFQVFKARPKSIIPNNSRTTTGRTMTSSTVAWPASLLRTYESQARTDSV
jgi:hypothetical protein